MSTLAKREKRIIHLPPAGAQQAVCYAVWDIGKQKGEYQGHPTVTSKLIFGFEFNKRIDSEDNQNGKRYTITYWVTNSLGKKANLLKMLESWLGRNLTELELEEGFETRSMIGKNCFLNIALNDKGEYIRAEVKGIMALPDGMSLIKPENEPAVQEWVQRLMDKVLTDKEAEEWLASKGNEEESSEVVE